MHQQQGKVIIRYTYNMELSIMVLNIRFASSKGSRIASHIVSSSTDHSLFGYNGSSGTRGRYHRLLWRQSNQEDSSICIIVPPRQSSTCGSQWPLHSTNVWLLRTPACRVLSPTSCSCCRRSEAKRSSSTTKSCGSAIGLGSNSAYLVGSSSGSRGASPEDCRPSLEWTKLWIGPNRVAHGERVGSAIALALGSAGLGITS